jgi:hypothetical protein
MDVSSFAQRVAQKIEGSWQLPQVNDELTVLLINKIVSTPAKIQTNRLLEMQRGKIR